MATTATTENDTDRSLGEFIADAIGRSFTIGTDHEDHDHHYYRPADTVVVYTADEIDHVECLDGRRLTTWVHFVAHRRGWASMGQLAQLGIAADTNRKGEQ